MASLTDKKIVLGITGSIAAYKAAELIRQLKKKGCEVKVVMTKSAIEFVAPLTYQTLSQNTVYTKMFDQEQELNIGHISLARWADIILVAPASADIIAKVANGIADDLLSTVCLASKTLMAFAPAMNEVMWLNPATQENIKKLNDRNMRIIGPGKGEQACGDNGPGRMLEPLEIIDEIDNIFTEKIFSNKKIMITAGPTQEPIDPVRVLTNHSSGKMGYAIAKTARDMGAEVTLITGPVSISPPKNITVKNIVTAIEMENAVMNDIKGIDIFISTAAVADYRPEIEFKQKHKKSSNALQIKFIKNPDILLNVASSSNPPFTVGFSAETENLIENAKEKLKNKKINMIAANIVGKGKGFNTQDNNITIIDKDYSIAELGSDSKENLAVKLLRKIFELYK